jgi:hypothetical protein
MPFGRAITRLRTETQYLLFKCRILTGSIRFSMIPNRHLLVHLCPWRFAQSPRLILFGFLLLSTLLVGCAPPSDTKLKSLFNNKKDHFIKVVNMLEADKTMVRITPKYLKASFHANPKGGIAMEDERISAERWINYKEEFSEIGCTNGVAIDQEHGVVVFYFSMVGTSFDSRSQGIAMILPKPIPGSYKVVSQLDSEPVREGVYVVPIEGDWYVYFEY